MWKVWLVGRPRLPLTEPWRPRCGTKNSRQVLQKPRWLLVLAKVRRKRLGGELARGARQLLLRGRTSWVVSCPRRKEKGR